MAHANLNDLMAMPEMRTVKRTMDNMKDCIFIIYYKRTRITMNEIMKL